MKIVNRTIAACAVFFLLWCAVGSATPRLAAAYAQDCHLCHVNPTGGGLRNTFVTQYVGPREITLRPLSAHELEKWPSPKITDAITLGADLRFLYVAPDDIASESGTLDNSFYQMQGDVYIAIEPDPQFTLYIDRGLRSGFEVFVLARVLPYHGYLKAGQFVPDLGWRWDDHTRYAREKLGLDFPGATDVGIEIGARPGHILLSAGVFNGNGRFPDDNPAKAVVGRALYRTRIGTLNFAIGGSARWNNGSVLRERIWGLMAQANYGPFSYTGDYYGRRSDRLGDDDGRVWAWLFSQELDLLARNGLDFYVGYDFLDPNVDVRSGSSTQVSIGSRIYVRHFLKLEPVWRIEQGESAIGRRSNNRFELLIHAYY